MRSRREAIHAVALASVLFALRFAACDSWKKPLPRVYDSPDYAWSLRVTPTQPPLSPARATLFRRLHGRLKRIVWSGKLVNLPVDVFVSSAAPGGLPHFATRDNYGFAGHTHALVIYSGRGQVIKDYKAEDLLTPEELRTKVAKTHSSRFWVKEAKFESKKRDVLTIHTYWGEKLLVNLDDGRETRSKSAN